jgi:excisionase family DNA binding protein
LTIESSSILKHGAEDRPQGQRKRKWIGRIEGLNRPAVFKTLNRFAVHGKEMNMTMQARDKLMSPRDVSEMLGIPVHTLYRWRYKGDGPAGYRVGRHVRYRREAIDAWLEQRADKRSSE